MTEFYVPPPPPPSIEAEQFVLGAMLQDMVVVGQVAKLIDARDFYREDHRRIYQAMMQLVERNLQVNVFTVKEELEATNDLSCVGGEDYLGELVQDSHSFSCVRSMAKIIREKALLRQLAFVATEISGVTSVAYGCRAKQLRGAKKSIDKALQRLMAAARL